MKKYLWIFIPILTFLFLSELIIYNKIPLASDMVANEPMKEWSKKTTEFPHWFPNQFSGMPSYGGYIYTPGHPLKNLLDIVLFNKGVRLWFYLSLGGVGLFFLSRFLNVSTTGSLFSGISFALTPYVFGLINAGHNNKIMAGSFTPFLILFALHLMKNRTLKSVLILSIISALQLWTNHPQIVYYTWMIIFLWWFFDNVFDFINNKFDFKSAFKNIIFLIISIIISLVMVSDPYYEVYTFQSESNRGSPSVLDKSGDTEKGTKWEYATQWSFHPNETLSFLFPYYFGLQNFSIKDRSNPQKFMKQAAYWGYMPFTQSTHYMGLLIIIFSLIGFFYFFENRNRTEIILWLIILIFLLIGFGNHFSILYRPLFDFAPFFSKFRVPSMIYMMIPLLISIISAFGIDKILNMKNRDEILNVCYKIIGFFLLICISLFLFGEHFISFYTSSDERFPQYIELIKSIRIDLFNKGIVLSLFICSSALISIYLFAKNRISSDGLSYIFIAILITDLWIVNNEFLSLKSSKSMQNQFIKNEEIKFLLSDKSLFRIFPADDIGANRYGFWNIQSIGGYHAVKLRNYQDLMDIGGFRRPEVLNMLNVKYLITNKKIANTSFKKVKGFQNIYKNQNVLPKAWLVGKIKNVSDQKSSLEALMEMSFRPKLSAVVLNYDGPEFLNDISGTVTIKKYKPNEIIIHSESNNEGLLVLSEIFYKPGWKCEINGQKSKIFQTNHILRSVYVPKGNNKIKFTYDYSNWKIARVSSRVSFFGVIILICFIFYRDQKYKKS